MIFVEEKSLAILIFSGVFCRTKHTKHFIRNPSLTRISPTQSRNHYQNYLRSSELTYIPHLLFFPGAKKKHITPGKMVPGWCSTPHLVAHLLVIYTVSHRNTHSPVVVGRRIPFMFLGVELAFFRSDLSSQKSRWNLSAFFWENAFGGSN